MRDVHELLLFTREGSLKLISSTNHDLDTTLRGILPKRVISAFEKRAQKLILLNMKIPWTFFFRSRANHALSDVTFFAERVDVAVEGTAEIRQIFEEAGYALVYFL